MIDSPIFSVAFLTLCQQLADGIEYFRLVDMSQLNEKDREMLDYLWDENLIEIRKTETETFVRGNLWHLYTNQDSTEGT